MLEKGRLYSLSKDGSKDSLYLNIKNKRFLFGSSEYCTVRIYVDGIFPKHCVLTIGGQGKAYLEPLHPSALTLVNGIKIKHKVCLEDNDVLTILIKEFQFAYPPNSLSRNGSFERLILPYSIQMKPAQIFETLTLGKNWKIAHPFRESSVSNINCVPKKHICKIKSDVLKKNPEYLLNFQLQKPVLNISFEEMNNQEVNSYCDRSLMKYGNLYIKESPEEREHLAWKMYEFISFLRKLLNGKEEHLYDLWPILESVWKYCIARANEDILFLPLKSLNLKKEINVHKKSLQFRNFSSTSENLYPISNTVSEKDNCINSLKVSDSSNCKVDEQNQYLSRKMLSCTENLSPISNTIPEKENHCINSLEVSVSSYCKMNGQKQKQYSSRRNSISYKKRVSLAVKRYHLRKRKSILMVKNVENLELTSERAQKKDGCKEINVDEQGVSFNLEKHHATRTKRKRGYNKKEKGELEDKERGDLKIKAGKENILELTDNSGAQITISNLIEPTQTKEKQNSRNKGLKQESKKESIEYSATKIQKLTTNMKLTETKTSKRSYKRKESVTNMTGKSNQDCDAQELPCCQRITRSMAKKKTH